jgi:hypothetical protein
MNLTTQLKEYAKEHGVDLVGIASAKSFYVHEQKLVTYSLPPEGVGLLRLCYCVYEVNQSSQTALFQNKVSCVETPNLRRYERDESLSRRLTPATLLLFDQWSIRRYLRK